MTPDGRVALVTGSGAGIGHAVARHLAAAGCRVLLHGLEPADAMAPAVDALREAGAPAAAYVQADLAGVEGVAALMHGAEARFGGVDILVNNAVVRNFAPVEEFAVAHWDEALAVNLSAPFHAIRLALPHMRARGWGRIVNMSSVYGTRAIRNRVDYVTTKTALLGLTRVVALETAGSGITCNAVCPGTVETPNIAARVSAIERDEGLGHDAAVARFLTGKQPTGRFVEAASVAQLVVFLCGPAGGDITGAMLPVDGGWLSH